MLSGLSDINLKNVQVINWDDHWLYRLAQFALKIALSFSGKSHQAAGRLNHRQGKSSRRLNRIWQSLQTCDAVWIPHYNVGSDSLWPLRNGRMKAPVLLGIHDIHPAIFPEEYDSEFMKHFWNVFVPFARKCPRVVTHTQFQRLAFIEKLQIEDEHIGVTPIPPLIRPEEFQAASRNAVSREELKNYGIHDNFVFYPGSSTHAHKNHDNLIMAWKKLHEKLGDDCPTLVCTVKGHRWPEIEKLIKKENLAAKVVFTDLVPNNVLTALFTRCLFVVSPTRYEGGGSGPVADAILMAKPVACSKIPPIEEQMNNFGGGYTVFFDPDSVPDMADKLIHVIQDLPNFVSKAQHNQVRLTDATPVLWSNWAEYTNAQLEHIAHKEN